MKGDRFEEQTLLLRSRLNELIERARDGERPGGAELAELASVADAAYEAGAEERREKERLAEADRLGELERRRYQDLFENAPDAYVVTDLRGVIQDGNRAAALLLNVPQALLPGKPLAFFIGRTQRRMFRAHFGRLGGDPPRERELWIQPRRSPPVPVGITANLVREGKGRPVGRRWLIRDLTARTRVDEARRRTAGRLETLARNAPVALLCTDPAGTIVSAAGAAWGALGMAADELVGLSAATLFGALPVTLAGGTPSLGSEVLRRAIAGEVLHGTFERPGALFELHCAPLRGPSGEVLGIHAAAVNVTGVKESEPERELAAAAEQARRWAAFLAGVGEILSSSLDSARALAGIARLATREIADACVIHVVTESGGVQRIAQAHKDDVPAELVEALAPRALETRTSSVHSAPEGTSSVEISEHGFDATLSVPLCVRGEVLGAITVASRRPGRRYDSENIAVFERMARCAALALDNARLYERAQQAIRARDELLSIAAHELKSPLTTLQLGVQNLSRALRGTTAQRPAPPVVASGLEVLERQGARIARLVDELFDVARLTAGRLHLEPEEVDLVEVARETVTELQEELDRARCDVVLRARGPIRGRWDPLRLRQCAANLLSNAMKYGRGKPIEIAVEAEDARARLWVTDHGIGIDPEMQARIFERFERAGVSRDFNGLGLGLYIVSRIAEAHGGTVRVESRKGEGATFVLELPLPGERGLV